MNIVRGFDKKTVEEIARMCGADSVRGSISYISAPFICENKNFLCEVFDERAFFAGTMCRKHFRLYELAVKEDYQKKGYGVAMITRIKQLCRKHGAEKITLRTSKYENAINFYKRIGGTIVGEKDDDYEVEIKV
jgi:GNAT superfamily N-acetyltransferase